jgi:hypothetical protein
MQLHQPFYLEYEFCLPDEVPERWLPRTLNPNNTSATTLVKPGTFIHR